MMQRVSVRIEMEQFFFSFQSKIISVENDKMISRRTRRIVNYFSIHSEKPISLQTHLNTNTYYVDLMASIKMRFWPVGGSTVA